MSDRFLGSKRDNLERLSRYSVRNDRWDLKTFEQLLAQQPSVSATRKKLADNIAGEMGYDEIADLIWLMLKVTPEMADKPDVRPSRHVNHRVNEEVIRLPSLANLRRFTLGDPIATVQAVEEIEPEVETVYDRLREAIKRQEQYEQALRDLLEAREEQRTAEQILEQWLQKEEDEDEQGGEAEGEGKGQGGEEEQERLEQAAADARDKTDGADQAAADALANLEAALNGAAGEIQGQMNSALQKAADSQEAIQTMAETWGTDPGSLRRLPAKERIRLARKLGTPKFRQMAALIGPMFRLADAEQKRKVVYTPEEIYDLGLGDDIPRVIPPELARLDLGDEVELLFWKDFHEKHLVQYEMKGFEKIALGGIIYCHDGSGSMSGEREMWAKAVGLALLHIARKQKRSFYGIQFGSASEIRIDDFRDTKNITPDRVIDFAEYFFHGGTNFEAPLRKAQEILKREHAEFGAVRSDIVFATDGQAPISRQFMEAFKELQRKLEVRVWGIAIAEKGSFSEVQKEPLNELCDGKVATIKTIVDGTDLKDMFRGL